LNEQLQTALNSRVIIEQAKGKLAERLGVDMDQAFTLLRDRAQASNRRLSDLARAFIDAQASWPTRPRAGSGQTPAPARNPGTARPRPERGSVCFSPLDRSRWRGISRALTVLGRGLMRFCSLAFCFWPIWSIDIGCREDVP
jgi:hypothetical protein